MTRDEVREELVSLRESIAEAGGEVSGWNAAVAAVEELAGDAFSKRNDNAAKMFRLIADELLRHKHLEALAKQHARLVARCAEMEHAVQEAGE